MRGEVKNSNNEPMKLKKSGIQGRQAAVAAQAVSFPTRTTAKRVEVGKGGCEIGKWRSFSRLETASTRLFPPFSTQVVDFPRIAVVRVFREGKNSPRSHGGTEPRGAGTDMGKLN